MLKSMSMDSPYQNNRSTIYTLTLTNEEVRLKVIYVTFSQVIATPDQNVLLAIAIKWLHNPADLRDRYLLISDLGG